MTSSSSHGDYRGYLVVIELLHDTSSCKTTVCAHVCESAACIACGNADKHDREAEEESGELLDSQCSKRPCAVRVQASLESF